MTTIYEWADNQFGQKDVIIQTSERTKAFRKRERMQPLEDAEDQEIVTWAKKLTYESYISKREWHSIWLHNLYDYYSKPTFRKELEVGKEPNLNTRDTEIFIPPLIRRLTELTSSWLARQIFRAEPFIQFTNYKLEDKELTNIQRLYERKLQGDCQSYKAREKAKAAFTDLALYGNAVLKADFHQERVLTKRADLNLVVNNALGDLINDDDLLKTQFDGLTDDLSAKISAPKPYFEVVDQFAMFNPVFLGNFILDPYCRYDDWKNAAYMGDISYVNEEELWDMFGSIPKFRKNFHGAMGGYVASRLPFGIGMDPFVSAQTIFANNSGRNPTGEFGRKIHSVLYLETPKTQTCIVDESLVVYHKIRDPKIKRMGPWSYEVLRFPSTSGSLWSVGYGYVLRQLQKEQTYIASKRLQYLEKMHKPFIEVIDDAVDESKIKELKDCIMIRTMQPGSVNFRMPPAGAEEMYLNSESRNVQRAREFVGIPPILDGSSEKTHLSGVNQRIDAAQVQFDVLLDVCRDSFKSLYQKIHTLNMAYLEGSLPIYGAAGITEKNSLANSLSDEQIGKLRSSDVVLELNAGISIGEEKLKSFAQLLNTSPMAASLQALPPQYQIILLGQLLDMGGIPEFKRIFDLGAQDILNQMAAPPQGLGGDGVPPEEGMLPSGPSGIPPEMTLRATPPPPGGIPGPSGGNIPLEMLGL